MQLKQLGSSSCVVDPLGLRKNPRKRKITQPPALGTQWTVVNVKYRGATSLLRQGPASFAMLRGRFAGQRKSLGFNSQRTFLDRCLQMVLRGGDITTTMRGCVVKFSVGHSHPPAQARRRARRILAAIRALGRDSSVRVSWASD
jgi:hypothetical protein